MRNRCPKCKKFVKEKGFYCVGCAGFIIGKEMASKPHEIKPIKYLKGVEK